MLQTALFAAALAAASAAIPSEFPPTHARGGKLYSDLMDKRNAGLATLFASGWAPNTTITKFAQNIDHFDLSKGTFQQTYFVDTSFTSGTVENVILYISGEGPCLSSPDGILPVFAQKMNAFLIALEHRWYGTDYSNYPGNITSTEDLQTLSVDQVMLDVRAFINAMNLQFAKTPTWIVAGGSYAGALSAWLRQKNSDIISASWSSSGVVEAIYNFTAFDAAVADVLTPDCLASLKAVTAAAERAWDSPVARSQMLSLFNSTFTKKEDFMWMLADAGAMGVQYDAKDFMCSYLVPQPIDILSAFAEFVSVHYGPTFGDSCYYSTDCLSDPTQYMQWYNTKTWIFQCCQEMSFWQAGFAGSIRSQSITVDYFIEQCQAAFGPGLVLANTTAFNMKYGGLEPHASLITASQGSDDPWRTAGMGKSLNTYYPVHWAGCDGCGHCRDLHAPSPTDPQTIINQRAAMMADIASWVV